MSVKGININGIVLSGILAAALSPIVAGCLPSRSGDDLETKVAAANSNTANPPISGNTSTIQLNYNGAGVKAYPPSIQSGDSMMFFGAIPGETPVDNTAKEWIIHLFGLGTSGIKWGVDVKIPPMGGNEFYSYLERCILNPGQGDFVYFVNTNRDLTKINVNDGSSSNIHSSGHSLLTAIPITGNGNDGKVYTANYDRPTLRINGFSIDDNQVTQASSRDIPLGYFSRVVSVEIEGNRTYVRANSSGKDTVFVYDGSRLIFDSSKDVKFGKNDYFSDKFVQYLVGQNHVYLVTSIEAVVLDKGSLKENGRKNFQRAYPITPFSFIELGPATFLMPNYGETSAVYSVVDGTLIDRGTILIRPNVTLPSYTSSNGTLICMDKGLKPDNRGETSDRTSAHIFKPN